MAQVATAVTNKPAWVDLATTDAEAARDFYSRLFGWSLEVSDDPQYGGYATAKLDDTSVAGIGPKQEGDPSPPAWSLYIGTADVDELAKKVQDAGGSVVVQPLDVGDQGRMAVFADPSGAFISGWQTTAGIPDAFGWAELNARGLDRAVAFYETVFGWTHSKQPFGEGEE